MAKLAIITAFHPQMFAFADTAAAGPPPRAREFPGLCPCAVKDSLAHVSAASAIQLQQDSLGVGDTSKARGPPAQHSKWPAWALLYGWQPYLQAPITYRRSELIPMFGRSRGCARRRGSLTLYCIKGKHQLLWHVVVHIQSCATGIWEAGWPRQHCVLQYCGRLSRLAPPVP